MNDNVYKVELLEDLDISPIFNISDLYKFHRDISNAKVVDIVN